ncbi:ribosomal RNA small subunit methyltransferase RsmB/transcription antitermination factor NusB [Clostridium sp. CAG:354]|nr:16S rRNA (cytosine(967)-C(5))-methyltransferase RsmB [Clostridia bacterium]CDE10903.1 ribosomal RNA small subunit methyltransferase RsmB/transcription antitermination factor NusB [Clostridium sp. CAG:354]
MRIDFARNIALKSLYEINTKQAYSNIVLDKYINENREKLSKLDINFISELVYGVVTWKLTLEYIIQKYSKIKLKKMSDWVKNILYLGSYQILFLDKVPKSAAVNESVNLCKKYNFKSVGLVNAILRKIEKSDYEEINTITNSITRISLKYSMPEWIVKKFCDEYGNEEAANICQNLNLRPNISVRLNRLKDKIELGEKGILEDFRVITGTKNITKTKEYIEGNITIQDEAAGLSSFILAPKEGEMVLDACSAPGGKTTYLAELMCNQGNIVAWDIYEERLKQVKQNAKRLGINIIQTEVHDATKLKEDYVERFDKILLDVPCLGLGVIRRKPDIKWNRQENNIKEISDIQFNILKTCSKYLKKNGTLVYSTCSMLKEENDAIIEKFIKDENFEIVDIDKQIPKEFSKITTNNMVQFLPSQKHDGFFITMLKKI